jgi:hypothetical protein
MTENVDMQKYVVGKQRRNLAAIDVNLDIHFSILSRISNYS